ncbi:maleylacetoacetate isomerase [Alteromonas sp. a30]|uniref:maleylacetoacetate isomerase n=1 Tax=Alteromonas sp. a30 TaxID=2730917 RepID=UPI00227F91E4|nr:maleylacetoacetate isomerase [Alteromonas sp. a30]MCY7295964.1 maleylacetoacetate isomerase [Alteromonas sp. a30]
MKLYGYWRSSATYRVRLALNLKGIEYQYEPVHLVKNGGEQYSGKYQALNPAQLVPTLVDEKEAVTLNQSLAIIEYLEEAFPESPPLISGSARQKALIRTIAYDVACDTQPIANLRVLNYVAKDLAQGDAGKVAWAKHWIAKGLASLETRIAPTSGLFCVGDEVSLADVCLIPQVYNAERFNIDLSPFPTIKRVAEHCNFQPAFIQALPENQPDAAE